MLDPLGPIKLIIIFVRRVNIMRVFSSSAVLVLASAASVVIHAKGFFTNFSQQATSRKVAALASESNIEAIEPQEEGELQYDFSADFTGTKRSINWPASGLPVPLHSEISLLKSGVLSRRGEFTYLRGAREDEIAKKCEELGMAKSQGMIVRKQYLVTNVVRRTNRLLGSDSKSFHKLQRQFRSMEKNILELSHDVDLPPVSIVRAIIRSRVDDAYPDWKFNDCKKLVKNIISGQANEDQMSRFLLSEWEAEQLQLAKKSDIISYQDKPSELQSDVWEEDLYKYLKEMGINYTTEDDMRKAGSRITPDCLLLDECVINGKHVRWIDVKMSFASGLKENWHFAKKLKKQIAKYEDEYNANGAVIFKHGFSIKLARQNPYTLFLDAGPLA